MRNRLSRWDNDNVPLGVYISVPFCRTKCSYCNFASGVFSVPSSSAMWTECARTCERGSRAAEMGGKFETGS